MFQPVQMHFARLTFVTFGIYILFQRIRVEAQIDAAHQGYYEIELCPQVTETNNCFQRLPVLASNNQVRDGTACVTMATQLIWAEVQLPAGVRCTRCTLRWTYRTAYPPGVYTNFYFRIS